jgi:hypothetical protein
MLSTSPSMPKSLKLFKSVESMCGHSKLCRHRRDGMGAVETAFPCNGAGSDMGHSRL